jgi:hypothetical protein
MWPRRQSTLFFGALCEALAFPSKRPGSTPSLINQARPRRDRISGNGIGNDALKAPQTPT